MSRRRRSRPLAAAEPTRTPTRTLSDADQLSWVRQDLTRLAGVLALLVLLLGAATYWQHTSSLPQTIADQLARFAGF